MPSGELRCRVAEHAPQHASIDEAIEAADADGTRSMLDIDRGQGVYIVAYRDGKPSEIFFAGYSFD